MNGYNPYGYGFSVMPNRIDQYQQSYTQPYQTDTRQTPPFASRREQLLGYVVNNIDDAKSAKIDFDGSTSYFPCPSENTIYAKTMDLDGRVVMKVYKLQNVPQMQYADNNVVENLQNRLDKIEKILREELGYNNESVTNNANVTK